MVCGLRVEVTRKASWGRVIQGEGVRLLEPWENFFEGQRVLGIT